MKAGRSARATQPGDGGHRVGIGIAAGHHHRVRQLGLRRPEDVEREVEEDRAPMRRQRGHGGLVDHQRGLRPVRDRVGRLGDGGHDRDVVQLLERARSPPALGRPAAEHHQRRPVEPRRGDGRDPVGDPRPRGQHGQTRGPGELGVGLGGEGGRLLVAGVDHAHALVAGRLVQRPDMAAVEREHHVHAEGRQRSEGLLAGMPGHRAHRRSLAGRSHDRRPPRPLPRLPTAADSGPR